jgi:hypothetical protein
MHLTIYLEANPFITIDFFMFFPSLTMLSYSHRSGEQCAALVIYFMFFPPHAKFSYSHRSGEQFSALVTH